MAVVRVHDYLILSALEKKELVGKVRKLCEEGWEPQGGLIQDKDGKFTQAIVLRQDT